MAKSKVLTINQLLTRSDIQQTLELAGDACRDATGLLVIIRDRDGKLGYVSTFNDEYAISSLEIIKNRILNENEEENNNDNG